MKKIIYLFSILFPMMVLANPPIVWGPNQTAQMLTGAISFTPSASTNFIMSGSLVPNVTAVNAPKGSLYASTSGTLFIKNDAGLTTNWSVITGGAGGSGTVTSVTFTGDGTVLSSTPSAAVTTTGTVAATLNTQIKNTALLGPTTGSNAAPTFRALVGADLPAPSASTLGGIQSTTGAANSWISSISTLGVPALTQPAFTNISGTLPNSQLATMAANTIKGNNTGSTATPVDMTAAQLDLILPTFTSTLNGLVPLSGGGTANFLRADGTWVAPGGSGTVTSTSVVSANGFAGTVATATSTPAITLATTATGMLKGASSALTAATAGTDYSAGTSALGTGILKSTTGTGALTIAVAADFPTLNQSTTGTASNVTGTVAVANGGTGVTTSTGTTNVVLSNSPVLVTPNLGTPSALVGTNITGTAASLTSGLATSLAGGLGGQVPYQSALNTTSFLANGTAGQVLTSAGTTLAPTWAAATPLTTKGDILGYSTLPVRIGVGADNQTNIADSSSAAGMTYKWPRGKNYLSNGDLESGTTTGWTLGTTGTLTNGIPTGTPTFGSGASGNLSLTAASSSPLEGGFSLGYVSSAATTAGNMVASSAMALDILDRGKPMTFNVGYQAFSGSANVNMSATSSNSYGIAAYDVTNSAWLNCPNFSFKSLAADAISVQCFTTTTTASVRAVIYNINATAGAATMYFDAMAFGPSAIPGTGFAGSDFTVGTTSTSAFSGFGTVSSIFYKSRRVGDSLEVIGSFTTGTTAGTQAQIGTYYNGVAVTVDTSKSGAGDLIGEAANSISATTFFSGGILSPTSNQTYVNAGVQQSTTSVLAAANGSVVAASTTLYAFHFTVPIVGWTSNTAQSSDGDPKIVAMQVSTASPTATITSTPSLLKFGAGIITDTAGGFSTSTGLYTVQVSGQYRVTSQVQVTATYAASNTSFLGISKNGAAPSLFGNQAAGGASGSLFPYVSVVIPCNAGDTLAPFIGSTGTSPTIGATAANNYFMVEKLSGMPTIQATETVSGRYTSSASTITSTDAAITYTTKDYDDHSAYSGSTFTAPANGKYHFDADIITAGTYTAGVALRISLAKNGSVVSQTQNFAEAAAGALNQNISDTLNLKAGDTIQVFVGSDATTPTIAANATRNYFSFIKVGN